MALKPGGATTRLVQVRGVDPGYPFYGTVETAPAGEWARLGEGNGAIVDGALLPMLGARLGDEIQLGEARFAIRATIENMPGDVGAARRARAARVRRRGPRSHATKLLTSARAGATTRCCACREARMRTAIAARVRGPLSAERASVRTVAEDQRRLSETLSRFGNFLALVALVALLLGGLGVAQRRARLHQAPAADDRRAALPGCRRLDPARRVPVAGGRRGPRSGACSARCSARRCSSCCRACWRACCPWTSTWAPSWRAILGGVGVGVWVAIVFSLLPLLAVRHVSPLAVLRRDYEQTRGPGVATRCALAALLALVASVVALVGRSRPGACWRGLAFVAGVAVALGLLALAAFLLVRGLRRFFPSRLPYLYRQGLANLYRPANQTLLVVLALGFGVFLLSTLLLVQHNLLRELRVDRGASRPNLVFFDVQPDQERGRRGARARGGTAHLAGGADRADAHPVAEGARPPRSCWRSRTTRQRPERWALRREYRSSYRDAPADAEKVVAGAWWRPGEWKGRAPGETPVPIALDANLARELRLGGRRRGHLGRAGRERALARRRAARGAVGALRAELLRRLPRGPARRRAAELRPALARRGRRQRARGCSARSSRLTPTSRRSTSPRCSGRSRPCSTRWCWRCASWRCSASPPARSCSPGPSPRAASSACARARCCARSARRAGSSCASCSPSTSCSARSPQRRRSCSRRRPAWALVRFAVRGLVRAARALRCSGCSLAIVALTIVVGLSGSTEVWRRPPLEVLRAE